MTKSDEIFIKDDSNSEPEIVKKPKRKLTEKQLANLAKGRAKMAEKRRLKNQGLSKEEIKKNKEDEKLKKVVVKEEKKAVKDIKKEKKEAKKKKNRLLLEQEREEFYFQELKERELEQLQNKKISNFQQIRTRYLTACKTTEEFSQLKAHLDSIDEETVLDDTKLKETLLKMISGYVKPRKKVEPVPQENLKITVDVRGLKKNSKDKVISNNE